MINRVVILFAAILLAVIAMAIAAAKLTSEPEGTIKTLNRHEYILVGKGRKSTWVHSPDCPHN